MLKSLQLLPSQKNALFKLAQDHGIPPGDFQYEAHQYLNESSFLSVPRLLHVSGFWFRVDRDDTRGFVATYSPSNETYQPAERQGISWVGVLSSAKEWMVLLKREIAAPDLWAALSDENALFQNGDAKETSDNLPFTPAELPEVRRCLEEIKAYVMEVTTLTEAQARIVAARFDHMEEAASRMGRKDWVTLIVGSLVGVASSLALTGDSTRDIFGFAALALKKFLGTVLYLSNPH